MISGRSVAAPIGRLAGVKEAVTSVRQWPLIAQLFALTLLALYAPVLRETATAWFTNDNYAHGVFIFPVALFLIGMQRDAIRKTAVQPAAWGLLPLAFGLLLETAGYLAHIDFLAMLSLIPVLAGSVLLLRGRETWKIVRFPITFLFFAAPLPGFLLASISAWIQSASTNGAVLLMRTLGYSILQAGNIIEIPGMQLGVEEACSGFKKLVALIAFAMLYGYLCRAGFAKRLLLVLVAIPIALLANILRVSGLVAVSALGGLSALHAAHDWAELAVLVIAFCLFVLFGRAIGCRTQRFSP